MNKLLPVGTRSLLFGAHQFLLHPIAVAVAWTRLYGFPRDFRLYVAFVVHDWGYWGCTDMDGFMGKHHPQTGGDIMERLFGKEWGDLCRFHSRHYSKLLGHEPSALCAPDKLANTVLPAWLYLTLTTLTGELTEYMQPSHCKILTDRTGIVITGKRSWYRALKAYLEQETKRTATEA